MQNTLNEARQALEALSQEENRLYKVADENVDDCWWCCGGGDEWLASIRERREAVYVCFPDLRP